MSHYPFKTQVATVIDYYTRWMEVYTAVIDYLAYREQWYLS